MGGGCPVVPGSNGARNGAGILARTAKGEEFETFLLLFGNYGADADALLYQSPCGGKYVYHLIPHADFAGDYITKEPGRLSRLEKGREALGISGS